MFKIGDKARGIYKGMVLEGTITAKGNAGYDWYITTDPEECRGCSFNSEDLTLIASYDGLIAPPLSEATHPVVTIADAYIAAFKASQPSYIGQAAQWKKDGRCPHCGELGRYSLSVAICNTHGEY